MELHLKDELPPDIVGIFMLGRYPANYDFVAFPELVSLAMFLLYFNGTVPYVGL